MRFPHICERKASVEHDEAKDRFTLDFDCPRSIGRVRSFYGNFGVLVRAFTYIRELGAAGFSLFAFWPVAEEEGYLETLRDEVCAQPADIPPASPALCAGSGRPDNLYVRFKL